MRRAKVPSTGRVHQSVVKTLPPAHPELASVAEDNTAGRLKLIRTGDVGAKRTSVMIDGTATFIGTCWKPTTIPTFTFATVLSTLRIVNTLCGLGSVPLKTMISLKHESRLLVSIGQLC